MERASYRVQLSEISVQSPRSRRTDTDYAAISVQVGDTTARTVTRRIGNVGRGTKAVNMSLSNVVLTSQTQLRITWSVVNYGGERHDVLMRAVGSATEEQTNESGMTQLSEAVSDVLADRKKSCDGPVFYATFEITGAELSGQLRPGKPLRITRRQQGMDAPSRCEPLRTRGGEGRSAEIGRTIAEHLHETARPSSAMPARCGQTAPVSKRRDRRYRSGRSNLKRLVRPQATEPCDGTIDFKDLAASSIRVSAGRCYQCATPTCF